MEKAKAHGSLLSVQEMNLRDAYARNLFTFNTKMQERNSSSIGASRFSLYGGGGGGAMAADDQHMAPPSYSTAIDETSPNLRRERLHLLTSPAAKRMSHDNVLATAAKNRRRNLKFLFYKDKKFITRSNPDLSPTGAQPPFPGMVSTFQAQNRWDLTFSISETSN